jgi:DNA-directed RNA polymerase subunit RPC12/RpoP
MDIELTYECMACEKQITEDEFHSGNGECSNCFDRRWHREIEHNYDPMRCLKSCKKENKNEGSNLNKRQ